MSLSHTYPVHQVLSESIHNFLRYLRAIHHNLSKVKNHSKKIIGSKSRFGSLFLFLLGTIVLLTLYTKNCADLMSQIISFCVEVHLLYILWNVVSICAFVYLTFREAASHAAFEKLNVHFWNLGVHRTWYPAQCWSLSTSILIK